MVYDVYGKALEPIMKKAFEKIKTCRYWSKRNWNLGQDMVSMLNELYVKIRQDRH